MSFESLRKKRRLLIPLLAVPVVGSVLYLRLHPKSPTGQTAEESLAKPIHSEAHGDITPMKPVQSTLDTQKISTLNPLPSPAVTTPVADPLQCKLIAFKRTNADEDLDESNNILKLADEDFNPASVCVRVNRVPVKAQVVSGKPEILVGAIEKGAEVTVRYCLGKTRCTEDCKIPDQKKDEFMEAIGAMQSDEGQSLGKWESENAGRDDEKDVGAAIDPEMRKAINEMAENAARKPSSQSITRDWKSVQESPTCQNHKKGTPQG